MPWAFPVQLLSGNCHKNSLITSQYWLQWRLGAIRQQAITRANIDPDLCSHMGSLCFSELMTCLLSAKQIVDPRPDWPMVSGALPTIRRWLRPSNQYICGMADETAMKSNATLMLGYEIECKAVLQFRINSHPYLATSLDQYHACWCLSIATAHFLTTFKQELSQWEKLIFFQRWDTNFKWVKTMHPRR